MSALRDAVAWLAAPVFGSYLGMVTLGGLDALVLRICPTLEATISPVVRIAPVDEISRDKDKVCFALHLEKLHAATPIKYVFFAEAQLSARIPLAAYLVDASYHRLKSTSLATHLVGERWTRHYCFDVPQTLTGLDFRVSGTALHDRHPFYETPTPVPSFEVAARS